MGADQWFEQVEPARSRNGNLIERELKTAPTEDLRSYALDLAQARSRVTSFGSMTPDDSSLPGRLGQLLDVSPSSDLTADGRAAYLDAVNTQFNGLRQSVDPVAARTITLAGRTTELPITITSRADVPLRVRVRLTSSKLSFPQGNEVLVTVAGGTAQVRIPVEARASGTFPVEVELVTPVGDEPVANSTKLTIRSTGLSGLGLALSVGALIVLAVWWVRHVQRSRRKAKYLAAAQRHPSTALGAS